MTGSNQAEIRQLAGELANGGFENLARLMDLLGDGLMRYLVSILADVETARDVFQDTWVRVMEHIESYDPNQSFEPWLFRIARNRAYDGLRRKQRWRIWNRTAVGETEITWEIPFHDDFPEKLADRELVRNLFLRLDARQREILWLRFYRDLSYEEISRWCRLPLGTVKSRLKRALDRLGRSYEEMEEEQNHVRQ